jgi:hypothetical protein
VQIRQILGAHVSGFHIAVLKQHAGERNRRSAGTFPDHVSLAGKQRFGFGDHMTAVRTTFLTLGIVAALGIGYANAQTSVTTTPGAQPTGQATPPPAGQSSESTMKNAATGPSTTTPHTRTRRNRRTPPLPRRRKRARPDKPALAVSSASRPNYG